MKKSKVSTGILVTVGVIILVVFVVVIVMKIKGTDLNGQETEMTDGVSVSTEKSSEEVKKAGKKDSSSVNGEEQDSMEIKQLYEQQSYLDVINSMETLDINQFSEEEKKSMLYMLEQSIYCYGSNLKSKIYSMIEQKNVDEASDAFRELTGFIDKMNVNEITAKYVYISSDQLMEMKEYLYDTYVKKYSDILYETYLSAGLDAMKSQLEECKNHIDEECYERLSAKIYTIFVGYNVNDMITKQIPSQEILMFIDDYLEQTGYAAFVLELWDTLFAQYREENNVESWSSEIKNISASGYILEDSSSRLLSESDISHLSRYELYVARFEIYARHGRGFADSALTKHFDKCSWYSFKTPSTEFDDFDLTNIERANVQMIYRYEVSQGYYHFATMHF